MPRVKSNVARLKRKNKIMKLAKATLAGDRSCGKRRRSPSSGPRNTRTGPAPQKADFRRLWITRINAAARLHQLSYSRS